MESLDDIYRTESLETLDDIEAALLALEECQDDSELIRRVFRGMHTIKGSGAMFGFINISKFAHQIEMIFEQIRNGELLVTHELMDLTLLSCDLIREMLAESGQGETTLTAQAKVLVEKIKAALSCPPLAEGAPAAQKYRLRIRPLIVHGARSELPILSREKLAPLGEYSFVHLGETGDAAADYQSCDILLQSPLEFAALRQGLLAFASSPLAGGAKMVGELFLVREEEGAAVGFSPSWWESQAPVGTIQVEDAIADQWLVTSALTDRPRLRGLQRKCQEAPHPNLFVVDKDNLDRIVGLAGELATLHEQMAARLAPLPDPQLLALDREMNQAIDALRRATMRMLWHLH